MSIVHSSTHCTPAQVAPTVFDWLVRESAKFGQHSYFSDLYHDAVALSEHWSKEKMNEAWLANKSMSFLWLVREHGTCLAGLTVGDFDWIKATANVNKHHKLFRVEATPCRSYLENRAEVHHDNRGFDVTISDKE